MRLNAVRRDGRDDWSIGQVPQVESAFVSTDTVDGAVRAMVGGFDFNRNKFNHVTQGQRQPGSKGIGAATEGVQDGQGGGGSQGRYLMR